MDGKRFVIAGLVAGTMLAGAVPAHANDADVIRRGVVQRRERLEAEALARGRAHRGRVRGGPEPRRPDVGGADRPGRSADLRGAADHAGPQRFVRGRAAGAEHGGGRHVPGLGAERRHRGDLRGPGDVLRSALVGPERGAPAGAPLSPAPGAPMFPVGSPGTRHPGRTMPTMIEAAFFDLDKTIVSRSSSLALVAAALPRRHGLARPAHEGRLRAARVPAARCGRAEDGTSARGDAAAHEGVGSSPGRASRAGRAPGCDRPVRVPGGARPDRRSTGPKAGGSTSCRARPRRSCARSRGTSACAA